MDKGEAMVVKLGGGLVVGRVITAPEEGVVSGGMQVPKVEVS